MDIVTLVKHYIPSETPAVVLPREKKNVSKFTSDLNAIAPCMHFLMFKTDSMGTKYQHYVS